MESFGTGVGRRASVSDIRPRAGSVSNGEPRIGRPDRSAAARRSAADDEFEKTVDQVNKKYLTSVSKKI